MDRVRSSQDLAFEDPIVWVLIIAVVVFLFGSKKIPELARGLGQARREFEMASKGLTEPLTTTKIQSPLPVSPEAQPKVQVADPLVAAARNEGIETSGKTMEEIASEIALKLNKNQS
jgi:sec-independent protein translocase protein TatA